MQVNFPSAPRKSVFPVSPGAKENGKPDKASFSALRPAEESTFQEWGSPKTSDGSCTPGSQSHYVSIVLAFFFVSLSLINALSG